MLGIFTEMAIITGRDAATTPTNGVFDDITGTTGADSISALNGDDIVKADTTQTAVTNIGGIAGANGQQFLIANGDFSSYGLIANNTSATGYEYPYIAPAWVLTGTQPYAPGTANENCVQTFNNADADGE